jgi:hypothetical protein
MKPGGSVCHVWIFGELGHGDLPVTGDLAIVAADGATLGAVRFGSTSVDHAVRSFVKQKRNSSGRSTLYCSVVPHKSDDQFPRSMAMNIFYIIGVVVVIIVVAGFLGLRV